MRGFFLTLTILSLVATGGVFAWRTLAPEGPPAYSSAPSGGGLRDSLREFQEERRAAREERRAERRQASQRQDWAMIASIASSIISALAAVAQAILSRR
ncbi:MAG: hypothetical protein NW215_11965 [Hyphomicrobiales bacterium]|nr:hypothetical protein [Hyphomicrobiales bacterium]